MNKKSTLVCALTAVLLGFSAAAFAERDGDFPELDGDRKTVSPYDNRAPVVVAPQRPGRVVVPERAGRVDRADRGDRGDRGYTQDGRYENRSDNARGGSQFRVGSPLPREYRSRQYVVQDWRAHQLPPPPRHYQWVQVGADYALVADATGLVSRWMIAR